MLQASSLSRRQLLRVVGLGGMALTAAGLSGCRRSVAGQVLAVRSALPQPWLKALPAGWNSRLFESPQALLEHTQQLPLSSALISLSDGWAAPLPREQLLPLDAAPLLDQLDPMAKPVSRLFAPAESPALAFPWAFGTWVVLLRNRSDLFARREEGWNLLLDPSLRGRLVLPASPRVLIELVLRQLERVAADATALADPRLPSQLRRLHAQALSLDERDGVNFLLAGDADAAVVTSQQALPLLQRDQRLTAFLPASGSPLWWQLLLHWQPAQAGARSPWPLEWLRDGIQAPLLPRLLRAGWVPPLPTEVLADALAAWPERLRTLLVPPPVVLSRCTTLMPLNAEEQQRWQHLWDQSLPG